ncbi:MAG TPA: hypothetical protein VF797_22880, partial [Noviherbaspirillum sp.]
PARRDSAPPRRRRYCPYQRATPGREIQAEREQAVNQQIALEDLVDKVDDGIHSALFPVEGWVLRTE